MSAAVPAVSVQHPHSLRRHQLVVRQPRRGHVPQFRASAYDKGHRGLVSPSARLPSCSRDRELVPSPQLGSRFCPQLEPGAWPNVCYTVSVVLRQRRPSLDRRSRASVTPVTAFSTRNLRHREAAREDQGGHGYLSLSTSIESSTLSSSSSLSSCAENTSVLKREAPGAARCPGRRRRSGVGLGALRSVTGFDGVSIGPGVAKMSSSPASAARCSGLGFRWLQPGVSP